jgi:hypothetical protein
MKAARDAYVELIHADTETVNQLANAGSAPVHLMMDLTDVGIVPGTGDVAEALVAMISHPKLGRTVAIGLPQSDLAIYQNARNALAQLTGKPIDFADTVADGLTLLRQHDSTLDA